MSVTSTSRTSTSSRKRLAVLGALGIAIAFTVTGCSQKFSAERDGKKLGEAVCDVRNADTAEDRDDAVAEAKDQLNDLGNKYALFTAEDRADVENNLADLAEHSIQGNDVLINQDLTVLRRSVRNIREDLSEVGRAAWDGFFQGLSDCQ